MLFKMISGLILCICVCVRRRRTAVSDNKEKEEGIRQERKIAEVHIGKIRRKGGEKDERACANRTYVPAENVKREGGRSDKEEEGEYEAMYHECLNEPPKQEEIKQSTGRKATQ